MCAGLVLSTRGHVQTPAWEPVAPGAEEVQVEGRAGEGLARPGLQRKEDLPVSARAVHVPQCFLSACDCI